MAVEKITLRLVGVGPMLMHSSRLADPLDPQWLLFTLVLTDAARTT